MKYSQISFKHIQTWHATKFYINENLKERFSVNSDLNSSPPLFPEYMTSATMINPNFRLDAVLSQSPYESLLKQGKKSELIH